MFRGEGGGEPDKLGEGMGAGRRRPRLVRGEPNLYGGLRSPVPPPFQTPPAGHIHIWPH